MAKILLVEDDNNLREIYEARLQAEGYEIASAMDGEEALVLAEKFPLRGLVRALVFLPWAVPGLIAALTWRWIYDESNGVLNLTLVLSGLSSELIY